MSMKRNEVEERIERSLALINLAVSLLREKTAEGSGRWEELAAQIEGAKADLVNSLSDTAETIEEAATRCIATLDDILGEVIGSSELESAPPLSLEIVVRIQAILYPVARLRDPWSAKPPPVLKERRPSEEVPPQEKGRRTAVRVPLETDVTLEGDTNFYTGFVRDISTGGLFVCSYNLLSIGTKVELTFTLPGGYVVYVNGEVRWIRDVYDPNTDSPPGMGIMFEDLLEEDAKAIADFVAVRAPMFYEE